MKLTILGGGGFRVPQVYEAIAAADVPVQIDNLSLYDTNPARLAAVSAVIGQQAARFPEGPRVQAGTDLDEALRDADFVFCAIREGGTAGRIRDERIALSLGVLGQETTGAGGLAYALRTVPEMLHLARRVRDIAPEAWFINFTNPAGLVTEALAAELGERVAGICDTPAGLLRRAARAAGANGEVTAFDYVGLNHLGWLRAFEVAGADRLPALLADDGALAGIEEAQLLGYDWVRALGALPNEYLYYYYFTREAIAHIEAAGRTRGEFLDAQQRGFYDAAAAQPGTALPRWERALHERSATYMAEARPGNDAERPAEEVTGGGYQQVALDLMAALATGRPATLILNVRNGTTVPGLPPEAVVEVPCTAGAAGIRPLPVAPVAGEMLGLMQSVKAAEQLAIAAVRGHSAELAWRAFAAHPLVDSAGIARELLRQYRSAHPGIEAALSS